MVRLTSELIARGTSGYIKRRRDEGVGHFITDQLAATNPKQISNLLIRHIDNHG